MILIEGKLALGALVARCCPLSRYYHVVLQKQLIPGVFSEYQDLSAASEGITLLYISIAPLAVSVLVHVITHDRGQNIYHVEFRLKPVSNVTSGLCFHPVSLPSGLGSIRPLQLLDLVAILFYPSPCHPNSAQILYYVIHTT